MRNGGEDDGTHRTDFFFFAFQHIFWKIYTSGLLEGKIADLDSMLGAMDRGDELTRLGAMTYGADFADVVAPVAPSSALQILAPS